jgi:hypothetical protein
MERRLTKAGLIDWVRRERAGWELLLAEVGVARMEIGGPMGDWTFKDLLVHLAEWQRADQALLAHALTGERPALPWPADLNPQRDQDRINQTIYERTHLLPVGEVIEVGRRVWAKFEDGIAALDDAALLDPDHFPWMEGEALGSAVIRSVATHFHQDHEVDVRAWLASFPAG